MQGQKTGRPSQQGTKVGMGIPAVLLWRNLEGEAWSQGEHPTGAFVGDSRCMACGALRDTSL